MTMRRSIAFLSVLALSDIAQSQSIADRVAAQHNGAVLLQFASRPGVCGDGYSFIRFGRSYHGSYSDVNRYADCTTGPVQVRLTLHDGVVDRVETWVGPLRTRDAKSLGTVSAKEGADYMMSIAARGSSHSVENAIFAAVLADSATVWPQLLRIAHDTETRSHSTRQDATHWLSRFAAGALVGRPNDPFTDDNDDDRDKVKDNAVFVLSQLRDDSRIPALIDIARKNSDRHVRSSALFWLGQSGDARALELFESLLK